MTTKHSASSHADRLFAAGLAAHQAGRLDDAFAQYEAALQKQPRHFDSLHHVGILGYQIGNHELALQFMSDALAVNPRVSAVYSNLGNIFKAIDNLPAALQSYEQALGLDKKNVDALYNRGNVLQSLKRHEEALASYERSLALAPRDIQAWNNRAVVLQELGRNDDALDACAKALKLDPDHLEALDNRGNILIALGRADDALESYDRAIALQPAYIKARINRAKALRLVGALDDALAAYDAMLAEDIGTLDAAEAHHGRANVLRHLRRAEPALEAYQQAVLLAPKSAPFRASLGHLMTDVGHLDSALRCFDVAIALDPELPASHNGRGIVLQRLRRRDEAMAAFERALAIDPAFTDSLLNRGNVLQDMGRSDEALAVYDEVLALKGDSPATWNNRGNVYEAMRRYEDALHCFDRSLEIDQDYAPAHWNRALLNLQYGALLDGWKGYEWRWSNELLSVYNERRDFKAPLWLGAESLEGKTILLFAEQGLGDSLQFCRYVPLVKARGARVVLEVQRPLVGLLKSLDGVDVVLAKGETLPPFDFHCPLMSLPLAFGTEVDTIPAAPRYLDADPARVAAWQARLGPRQRPRVGLVWSGNVQHANDHNRSIPFAQLAPLLGLDCDFYSLQKEYRPADLPELDASVVQRMDAHLNDFADTAALCEAMDVVIAVDTSVAHLAAALGRPVWLLLPHVADWRWLTAREDSPWYPSVRLLRQPARGDYAAAIASAASGLGAL